MKRVLFLCTGNYYRSRFAEIFFNWHACRRRLMWQAESRGLALQASNLGAISSHTVARLQSLGIPRDTDERLPLAATRADFERAAHIVAVKRTEHQPLMESLFPVWLERVQFWEVHDVDCALPSEALSHLEREVTALIERLASKAGASVRVA